MRLTLWPQEISTDLTPEPSSTFLSSLNDSVQVDFAALIDHEFSFKHFTASPCARYVVTAPIYIFKNENGTAVANYEFGL
jgi:hypothetical protein